MGMRVVTVRFRATATVLTRQQPNKVSYTYKVAYKGVGEREIRKKEPTPPPPPMTFCLS